MSGPVETVVGTSVVFVALVVALLVPLPRQKPEEPKPDPVPVVEKHDEAAQRVDPPPASVTTPAPETQTDSERISQLERTVHEIKVEQQQLADDIRTLVQEIKDK